MVEYTKGYVTIDGIKLHYYKSGSGSTTVILLHGATDNGMCWKPTSDLLAEEYTVYMPDALGHGFSDRFPADFKFSDQARLVVGLVRELGIKNPVFMGHSMGGSMATNIAGLYPEIPKGIILEDPGWSPPRMPQPDEKAPPGDFAKRFDEMSKKSLEELIAQGREENPLWSEDELVPWAEAKQQYDTRLFSMIKIDDPPWTEVVPKIKCPALLSFHKHFTKIHLLIGPIKSSRPYRQELYPYRYPFKVEFFQYSVFRRVFSHCCLLRKIIVMYSNAIIERSYRMFKRKLALVMCSDI